MVESSGVTSCKLTFLSFSQIAGVVQARRERDIEFDGHVLNTCLKSVVRGRKRTNSLVYQLRPLVNIEFFFQHNNAFDQYQTSCHNEKSEPIALKTVWINQAVTESKF